MLALACTAVALFLVSGPIVRASLGRSSVDEVERPLGPGGVISLTLVVPTFFASTEEPRFELTVKSLVQAALANIPIVVIDASDESVRERLRATGAHVLRQSRPGKKGVALREGIEEALRLRSTPGHVIGTFEPEKLGMVFWMRKAADHLRRERLGIVVPGRERAQFETSYPKEQYHQESFANLLIDSVAMPRGFPPGIDWTFGPVLFDARLAHLWTRYTGTLWDAQVVPYVRAVLWHGASIGGFSVPYSHPAIMRAEEEGKARWAKKRYEQLRLWAEVLPAELNATAEPAS
ncbi:hypothetical protein T492DRAFT_1039114 [Pavlovales sp. CCMP2436]|nr:hypothetical protein T492DRAFT_1039114 [Pavlovales sp. CCMP2436]